jgi:glucuronate isomerase
VTLELHPPKIQIFDLRTALGKTALALYDAAADQPLICPHGHVSASLFSTPTARFGNPAELFVIPDHYITRMLISQGIPFRDLGLDPEHPVEPRRIWQVFCDHFFLFDGTPSGLWVENELSMVFNIQTRPGPETADRIYDEVMDALAQPEFSPRALFDRFNIEVMCTTDAATDLLQDHQIIRETDWGGDIRPTFRPDALMQIQRKDWMDQIHLLENVCDFGITGFDSFIQAVENRRSFFKANGAVATDHGAETAFTIRLSHHEVEKIFQNGLRGKATWEEARLFSGHMIYEMARMSCEDGLVMQFHVGSSRNHHGGMYHQLGADSGFDIPLAVHWTENLKPLTDAFGMDPRLRLILFTLDESGYSRELAPLAGVYPSIRLGPPWWFHDSPNGMLRYFRQVIETAGIYNTVGFNDDTRAFLSIPARHDLWRRMGALWLAELVHRGQVQQEHGIRMIKELAYGLAKSAYRLDGKQDHASWGS